MSGVAKNKEKKTVEHEKLKEIPLKLKCCSYNVMKFASRFSLHLLLGRSSLCKHKSKWRRTPVKREEKSSKQKKIEQHHDDEKN